MVSLPLRHWTAGGFRHLCRGLVALLLGASSCCLALPAIAETSFPAQLQLLLLVRQPLDPDVFAPDYVPPTTGVVTSQDISQTGLTQPSLWWVAEQFGDRLLENWVAFPEENRLPPRVDLMVNEQVWNIYQTIERYAFVHQFGSAAQEFGYITRVYDRRGALLAAYLCDYGEPADTLELQGDCNIFLNWEGGTRLQAPASAADALPATGGRSPQP